MNAIDAVSWFDLGVLLIIIWCAIDGNRQVVFSQEPARAIAYYGLAVGTAGYLYWRTFASIEEAIWTTVMHLAIMTYAILHLLKRYGERRKYERIPRVHLRWHF